MIKTLTLEEVVKAKPKLIIFSANTVWWTHDEKDIPEFGRSGIPLDPFGSPLLQTEDVKGFLDAKEIEKFGMYGAAGNRVRNLMLCHAQNIEWVRKLENWTPRLGWPETCTMIDKVLK